LKDVPIGKRQARFVCVMVIARHGKALAHFRGSVEGRVLASSAGHGGFGYDPLFAPDGFDSSFAELGADIKNQLSHRSRALLQAMEWLGRLPD
jgi:XTP/dITP diphosphohydrolase